MANKTAVAALRSLWDRIRILGSSKGKAMATAESAIIAQAVADLGEELPNPKDRRTLGKAIEQYLKEMRAGHSFGHMDFASSWQIEVGEQQDLKAAIRRVARALNLSQETAASFALRVVETLQQNARSQSLASGDLVEFITGWKHKLGLRVPKGARGTLRIQGGRLEVSFTTPPPGWEVGEKVIFSSEAEARLTIQKVV